MGRTHVSNPGARLTYAFCPPTSGNHFNIARQGPIAPEFYGPESQPAPGGWIHNLEHGYVVVLYRCENGQCPSEEELAPLRQFHEQAPITPGATRCGHPKVLVARFDDMATRYAYAAWDRALLTDTFDTNEARAFVEQWADAPQVPERGLCL